MKNLLSKIVIFSLGAAAGSVVTWKLIETKYKQIADEEIESVKETFAKRGLRADSAPVDETSTLDKQELNEILKQEGYTNQYGEEEGDSTVMIRNKEPYVITSEELDQTDYELLSLTYYSDGVLADPWDEVIEDIEGTVGSDSLTHFEDDTVFVRNDRLKCDYEILLDKRKYSDVVVGDEDSPLDIAEDE